MYRTPRARCLLAVLTALLLVSVPTLAQKVSDVERRYQAALHAEQVEGNLTAALRTYEGLAAATNATTDIRLKALVRQAGIHDTLGLASDDLYRRITREFPARPEAAAAQRTLAARQRLAMAARQTATSVAVPLQGPTPVRSRTAVFVAQLDDSGRLSAWEPRVLENATVRSYVQLAPDGRHVVYVVGPSVRVQDITDAASPARELYRGSSTMLACIWARTQVRVFCGERKGGDTEIVAIDVASQSVERMATLGGPRYPLHVSPDDLVLSFNKDSPAGSPPGAGGISWVIGTDPPEESALTRTYATDRSEDGLWIVDHNTERIVPASGDGLSVALNRNVPRTLGFIPESVRFTADSQWVIYRGRDADGKDGVYRTSVSGVKERLGDHPPVAANAAAWLRFTPDGRHFLLVMDEVVEPN